MNRGGSGAALVLGAALLYGGYIVASFGWIMLRGWDIPFRSWVSPLNPYQWAGTPSPIPATQIFPSVGGGIEGTVPGGSAPLTGGGTNPGPAKGGTQVA